MAKQTQPRGSRWQKKQAALDDALASFEKLMLQEEDLKDEQVYKIIQEQVILDCMLSGCSMRNCISLYSPVSCCSSRSHQAGTGCMMIVLTCQCCIT
jgi:hypothetical protein